MRKLILLIYIFIICFAGGSIHQYDKNGEFIQTVFTSGTPGALANVTHCTYVGGGRFYINFVIDTDPHPSFIAAVIYVVEMDATTNPWQPLRSDAGLTGNVYTARGITFNGIHILRTVHATALPPRLFYLKYDMDPTKVLSTVRVNAGSNHSGLAFHDSWIWAFNGGARPDTLRMFKDDDNDLDPTITTSGSCATDGYSSLTSDGVNFWATVRTSDRVELIDRDCNLLKTFTVTGPRAICTDGVNLFIGD